MCDEIDRLRAENETLRQMHAAQSAKVVALRRWQQEACDLMEAVLENVRSDVEMEDLLRRAGKEVQ